MADKGPGSTSRTSGKKRLARAKVKRSEDAAASAKGAASANGAGSGKAEDPKKRLTRIGIGVFAVIMALSMTLPSFGFIFGNNGAGQEQQEQEAEQSAAADDASSDEGEDKQEQTATGMDLVDANYKAVVDPLEAKLKEDPKDLATLLNLGNDYMAWGNEGASYATDDAAYQHLSELYQKAISYYDSYLELNDSNAVKVSRALCQFYSGDMSGAQEALEKLTADAADYGPAWANLGLVYEYQGDQDKAKETYQKAAEVDADDEYGAKSFADRRIASMSASANGGELTSDAADVTSADDATNPLADALGAGL